MQFLDGIGQGINLYLSWFDFSKLLINRGVVWYFLFFNDDIFIKDFWENWVFLYVLIKLVNLFIKGRIVMILGRKKDGVDK